MEECPDQYMLLTPHTLLAVLAEPHGPRRTTGSWGVQARLMAVLASQLRLLSLFLIHRHCQGSVTEQDDVTRRKPTTHLPLTFSHIPVHHHQQHHHYRSSPPLTSRPPRRTPVPTIPLSVITIILYDVHEIIYSCIFNISKSNIRSQGFIQDFSTGGGSISATVQPPTIHEVGGGGNYASTDLIGPVGSARLVLQFMAVR